MGKVIDKRFCEEDDPIFTENSDAFSLRGSVKPMQTPQKSFGWEAAGGRRADLGPTSTTTARPVTHDSQGTIIPLSTRFDPRRQDCRCSISPSPDAVCQEPYPLYKQITESAAAGWDLRAQIIEELS